MNVTAAHDMIIRNQKWRLENNIDDIPVPIINPGTLIPNNIRGYKSIPDTVYYPLLPGSTYKESWKSFFQHFSAGCYHSKDKSGLPVYIERLGVLDPFPFMESCSHETLMDYHLSNVEFLHKVVFKECSEDLGKPVSKHTIIFDLEDLKAVQFLKILAVCDSDNYPETMNRVFLVNAPSIFSFGWSIVKGFLDAGTLDKIHILNSKEFSNGYLLDFIDADSLPKRYGGKCECTHMVGGCVPSYKDFEDLRKSNFEPGQGQSFGNAV